MIKKIYELDDNQRLIVTPDYIAITSKKTSDFSEIYKWSEMISMKDDFIKIPKKDLIKIQYNESGKHIRTQFSSPKSLDDSFTITPKNENDFIELANNIYETMSLSKKEKTENRLILILGSLFEFVVVLSTFGFLIYNVLQKQSGEEIHISSGRRQGAVRIAFAIVDTIGIPATVIIGIIFTVLIVYRAYQRFNKPFMEIILERNKN